MNYFDVIITWNDALPKLAMLRFDLGESSNSIKQSFDEGFYLRYHKVRNFWYWDRLTCADCEKNKSCEFAFDRYNTDGDCLAIK